MFAVLVVLCPLPVTVFAFPHCRGTLSNLKQPQWEDVFTSAREANLFIGRHLLNNRFDFEAFTDDNLERECYEELCNYEEAREFFEDPDKTMDFWKDYSTKDPRVKIGDEALQKINVTGLLISLVAAGVLLVIIALIIFYCCKSRCKSRQPPDGAADTPEGRDAIQRDLDKLKKWGHGNLLWFNKTNCWCCTWVRAAAGINPGWGWADPEQAWGEGSGELVGKRLDMSQECAPVAPRANSTLGCIQSTVRAGGEGILPLCFAEIPPGALHPAPGSQHRMDRDLLE
ncbi:hypothetical protein HGM15179_010313 [Zosterops borbonicus]|uniref:Gla domain-containing protein n=1 Tax=Zosterops borbonicus TaxID=364589 RepID=A0A8K1LK01_9PASS|nr:hypothetical protein HGM15179_010313 [Zosterops borbonicus]